MPENAYAYDYVPHETYDYEAAKPWPPPAVVREWVHEIGALVRHKDGGMVSKIMARTRASNGLEIYGVRAIDRQDPQRDRMVLGDVLIACRS